MFFHIFEKHWDWNELTYNSSISIKDIEDHMKSPWDLEMDR